VIFRAELVRLFCGCSRVQFAPRTRSAGYPFSLARCASVCFAIVTACGSTLAAQDKAYVVAKIDPSAKSHQLLVNGVLNGQQEVSENQQAIRDFYIKYYFPEMAGAATALPKAGPQGIRGNVAYLRQKLAKQLRQSRSGSARNFVNGLILEEIPKYANGNYHPAVRINAVLLLGDLDAQPPSVSGIDRQPPVPLPQALPLLLDFARDKKMPDSVKVAALVGVKRHAEYNLPDASRAQVTGDMLQLIAAREPPAGRSNDGHAWLRRQAAEVLGVLGDVGNDRRVYLALESVLNEQTSPLWLRCAAAQALGQLRYGDSSSIDTSAAVAALGQYTKAVVDGAVAAAKPSDFPRQSVAYRASCIRATLESIQKTSNAEAQEQAKSLIDLLQNLSKLMQDDQQAPAQLIDHVTKIGREAETVVQPAGERSGGGKASGGEKPVKTNAAKDALNDLSSLDF